MLQPFIKAHRSLSNPADGHGEASLELLMQLMREVSASQHESREDMLEINARLSRLETGLANQQGILVEQSIRLDGFSDRLDRMERQLNFRELKPF